MRHRIALAGAILALSTSQAASAQQASAICADLEKILAAAAEEPAFASLDERISPDSVSGSYLPSPVWGMGENRKCSIYGPYAKAGAEDIWHGASLTCEVFKTPYNGPSVREPALEAQRTLVESLANCDVLSAWTLDTNFQERAYRVPRGSTVWTDPETGIFVAATLDSETRGRRARRTTYTTAMRVSLPRPTKAE